MTFGTKFCIVLMFWENMAILEIIDSVKNKDMEFVENLKHELRRGNDDYDDAARRRALAAGAWRGAERARAAVALRAAKDSDRAIERAEDALSATNTIPASNVRTRSDREDERDKIIDKIRRRVNDAFVSKEWNVEEDNDDGDPHRRVAGGRDTRVGEQSNGITPINDVSPIKSNWKETNKIIQKKSENAKLNNMIMVSSKSSDLAQISTSTTLQSSMAKKQIGAAKRQQRLAKERRIEKFKMFIQKNEGLLREFIGSKMSSRAAPPPPAHGARLRQRHHSTSELRQPARQHRSREALPDARLLDMAPAKGGRIHQKRLRGRLCHRHVLVPEGPKYDSRGRAYLPPHEALLGHPYNSTREPPLLLPRCCNCCRKSALGCE